MSTHDQHPEQPPHAAGGPTPGSDADHPAPDVGPYATVDPATSGAAPGSAPGSATGSAPGGANPYAQPYNGQYQDGQHPTVQGYGPGYGPGYGQYPAGPGAWPVAGQGTEPGVPVGFIEAIRRFYSKFAQFTGRASRSEYWWVALYLSLVYLALMVISIPAMIAGGSDSGSAAGGLFGLLYLLFGLVHLVPSISLGVRRLHDAGFSGFFLLLNLVPLGGIVVLIFTLMGPNPAGARFDRR